MAATIIDYYQYTVDEGTLALTAPFATIVSSCNAIDQNGDGIIDLNDRTFIGNPNPDFIYGFNFNLNYKRLSASILFNGVYGNDIANGNLLQLENAEGLTYLNIAPDAYYNAWRPDAENNLFPRVGYTGNNNALAMNDRIIENGSYFRLKNITLGYDIPVKEAGVFSRCNIYLSGQNLITITDYSGYDPEITSFLWDATRTVSYTHLTLPTKA